MILKDRYSDLEKRTLKLLGEGLEVTSEQAIDSLSGRGVLWRLLV